MNGQDLFIFEIANNHQGSVDHGRRIISAMGELAQKHGVRGAMKFQLRQLDTFLHPEQRRGGQNKHVKRFEETRLSPKDFAALTKATRDAGLIPMATIFDEDSIPLFQDLGMEILKIGSCSATDYPLLEALGKTTVPAIVSTAGMSFEQIDRALWLLGRKPADCAIMHCVGLYPCPAGDLMLQRIAELRRHFPGHTIGFSTHEAPDATLPVQLAYALGARIFEKHVGVVHGPHGVNAYSATPEQVERWLLAYREAEGLCDFSLKKSEEVQTRERAHLKDLERAVFAARSIKKGEELSRDALLLAIPGEEGQARASAIARGAVAAKDCEAGTALPASAVAPASPSAEDVLRAYTRLTHLAGLNLPEGAEAEVSCHAGLERLPERGALLATLVNESVCKKFILLAPGQEHPSHWHEDRREFMRLVHGEAEVELGGRWRPLEATRFTDIPSKEKHAFRSRAGGVIEEITTRYLPSTSAYADPALRPKKLKVAWSGGRWGWVK